MLLYLDARALVDTLSRALEAPETAWADDATAAAARATSPAAASAARRTASSRQHAARERHPSVGDEGELDEGRADLTVTSSWLRDQILMRHVISTGELYEGRTAQQPSSLSPSGGDADGPSSRSSCLVSFSPAQWLASPFSRGGGGGGGRRS